MCELGNQAGLYVLMSRVDNGDWPWPLELTYRSGITGILDKNLEKGQESARSCIRRERHRDKSLLEGEWSKRMRVPRKTRAGNREG